ncbi:MAG: DUF4332 domain-containing protein [Methylococcales bacterium]
MGYLIAQIIVCLFIAALIGFILGWLLRGLSARSRETYLEEDCENRIHDLEAEWSKTTETREIDGRANTSINALATAAPAAAAVMNSESIDDDNDVTIVRPVERNGESGLKPLSHPIEKIEGIGKSLGNHLRNIKIKTTKDLIEKCGTSTGVQQVAKAAKVEGSVVREWVSMADLMRIPEMGGQFAELLQASGIQSVLDLGNEDAQSLAAKMELINQREHRVPESEKLPGAREVAQWVESARALSTRL